MKMVVVVPLFEGLSNLLLAKVKHVLGITTASLLQTPGGGVVEVKTVVDMAAIVVALEVVPLGYSRESFQGMLD